MCSFFQICLASVFFFFCPNVSTRVPSALYSALDARVPSFKLLFALCSSLSFALLLFFRSVNSQRCFLPKVALSLLLDALLLVSMVPVYCVVLSHLFSSRTVCFFSRSVARQPFPPKSRSPRLSFLLLLPFCPEVLRSSLVAAFVHVRLYSCGGGQGVEREREGNLGGKRKEEASCGRLALRPPPPFCPR